VTEYMQVIVPVAIFLLTLAAGALGWFCRTVYGMAQTNSTRLADHQLEVAKNYVTNERLEQMWARMDGRLNDIHVMVAKRMTEK